MGREGLVGRKFGYLTVLNRVDRDSKNSYWRCRCDCGAEVIRSRPNLRRHPKASCGCQLAEHGHCAGYKNSPTYTSWQGMIQRCFNKKHIVYEYYGGKGITVCGRWMKFNNFLADMGERPEGRTLDRYPDNAGNYEPSNCRWATRSEQNRNRPKYRHGHKARP